MHAAAEKVRRIYVLVHPGCTTAKSAPEAEFYTRLWKGKIDEISRESGSILLFSQLGDNSVQAALLEHGERALGSRMMPWGGYGWVEQVRQKISPGAEAVAFGEVAEACVRIHAGTVSDITQLPSYVDLSLSISKNGRASGMLLVDAGKPMGEGIMR
jgi:hypothetical protein